MFEGSEASARRLFRAAAEAGGSLNGSTSADRTNYWGWCRATRPFSRSDGADRMGWFLPALREALDTNRGGIERTAPDLRELGRNGMAQFA